MMNNIYITKSFRIKNLVHISTILLLKEKLTKLGYIIHQIGPGTITFSFNPENHSETDFVNLLEKYQLGIIIEKEQQLVEDTKIAIYELIHEMNNVNSVIRRSDYLVEKLGKSYQTLSRAFSKYEHTTLEKYLIQQKIERIKELVVEEEFTLSEISYMMEYSSVQYLSNQFKKIVGISVTDYKNRKIS